MSSNTARETAVSVHEEDAPKFEAWYQDDPYKNVFLLGRATMEPFFRRATGFLDQGARVLDAGCGVGQQMLELSRQGLDVHGIDPAEAMIALASKRAPDKVKTGSILEIPYESDSFAMAYSFEVFRYLNAEDNARGLQEMYRVLKPGGVFFASFVNKYALDGFYLLNGVRRLLRRNRCHHEFETPGGLQRKFSQAGFVQIETHGSLHAWLRVLYKLNEKLAGGVARGSSHFEGLCDSKLLRPFSGHLMVTARKPMK